MIALGSAFVIGLQSERTDVIRRQGLAPVNILDRFPQAPLLSLSRGRAGACACPA